MYTNRISFPVSPRHEPELIRDLERLLFYTRETPDGTLWGVGGKPSGDGEYKRSKSAANPRKRRADSSFPRVCFCHQFRSGSSASNIRAENGMSPHRANASARGISARTDTTSA